MMTHTITIMVPTILTITENKKRLHVILRNTQILSLSDQKCFKINYQNQFLVFSHSTEKMSDDVIHLNPEY